MFFALQPAQWGYSKLHLLQALDRAGKEDLGPSSIPHSRSDAAVPMHGVLHPVVGMQSWAAPQGKEMFTPFPQACTVAVSALAVG